MVSFAAVFVLIAAVVGSSVMFAIFASIFHRMRQIESGGGRRLERGSLENQLVLMREDLTALQDEITNLTDRVDFTERLLTDRSDDGERPGTLGP